mmetsp:Transcript_835/g.1851  ORF Transcript_835/g.1851 Transcript_835/m.1851 type:complete len:238 (+) Transcript_835:88-801(+)
MGSVRTPEDQDHEGAAGHLWKFAQRNSATVVAIARVKAVAALLLWALGAGEVFVVLRSGTSSCESAQRWWLLIDGFITILFAGFAFTTNQLNRKVVSKADLHLYLLQKERGAEEQADLEEAVAGVDMEYTTGWNACPSCWPQLRDNRPSEKLFQLGSFSLLLLFCVGVGLVCHTWSSEDSLCDSSASLDTAMWLFLTLKFLGPCVASLVSLASCLSAFMAHQPKNVTVWDDMPTDMW